MTRYENYTGIDFVAIANCFTLIHEVKHMVRVYFLADMSYYLLKHLVCVDLID